MKFIAQVKKVTTKTLASSDVGYCIELIGEDPTMMDVSKLAGEMTVTVEIKQND